MNNSDPIKLLSNALFIGSEHSETYSVKPLKDETLFSKPEKPDKEAQKPLTPAELGHSDKLYKPGVYHTLNNPDLGIELKMATSWVGPLTGLTYKDSEVIGPTPITQLLYKHNYTAIVDPNQAYIGDQKVDPLLLGEATTLGEDAAKIYVPTNLDGSPAFDKLEEFAKLYAEFQKNQHNLTTYQAEAFFARNNFPGIKIEETTNSDGTVVKTIINTENVKPFLSIPILTNEGSDLIDNP